MLQIREHPPHVEHMNCHICHICNQLLFHTVPFSLTLPCFSKIWSRRWESDPQSPDYKSGALPLSYPGSCAIFFAFSICFSAHRMMRPTNILYNLLFRQHKICKAIRIMVRTVLPTKEIKAGTTNDCHIKTSYLLANLHH